MILSCTWQVFSTVSCLVLYLAAVPEHAMHAAAEQATASLCSLHLYLQNSSATVKGFTRKLEHTVERGGVQVGLQEC